MDRQAEVEAIDSVVLTLEDEADLDDRLANGRDPVDEEAALSAYVAALTKDSIHGRRPR